jgi:hypothetical protein
MFPINITVTMDYKIYEQYWIFSLFRNSKKKRSKIMHLLPFLLALPFNIILLALVDLPSLLVPLLFFFILMNTILIIMLYITPKSNFKKLQRIFFAPQRYSFSEMYFEVCADSDTSNAFTKMTYSELFMVYETIDTFYLSISSNQSFIIPKNFLNEEQIIQIREAIIKNIEVKKYKKRF